MDKRQTETWKDQPLQPTQACLSLFQLFSVIYSQTASSCHTSALKVESFKPQIQYKYDCNHRLFPPHSQAAMFSLLSAEQPETNIIALGQLDHTWAGNQRWRRTGETEKLADVNKDLKKQMTLSNYTQIC